MTYYKDKYGYGPDTFANAAWISNNSITLPVGPHLDQADMNYIGDVLIETAEELSK
jgi:dTDP-4-amino-4,6-dideoxygalactose transaminase